jgi:hypothetical protein
MKMVISDRAVMEYQSLVTDMHNPKVAKAGGLQSQTFGTMHAVPL